MTFFKSLFRRHKPSAPPPQPLRGSGSAPHLSEEPPQATLLKTLLIVYDPVVDPKRGAPLSRYMHWNRVDDLTGGFMSDVEEISGGLARYQIVERIDVDAFPAKVDGYQYDAQAFLKVVRNLRQPYMPQEANYYAIIARFDILARVARKEIDEVWVFNFPHAGFYESIMGGPGAFWCNAPPLHGTQASQRRFVIMGFSYERGVGEMLENMGHRAESILGKKFEDLAGEANLWRRFTRYHKTAPGRAAVGNIHFAPNSQRDYDWGNPAPVPSECDDWLYNFPNLQGLTRTVTSADWGYGDIREHHKWWFRHLPKVGGSTNGIANNWWHYVMVPNLV